MYTADARPLVQGIQGTNTSPKRPDPRKRWWKHQLDQKPRSSLRPALEMNGAIVRYGINDVDPLRIRRMEETILRRAETRVESSAGVVDSRESPKIRSVLRALSRSRRRGVGNEPPLSTDRDANGMYVCVGLSRPHWGFGEFTKVKGKSISVENCSCKSQRKLREQIVVYN